MAIWKGICTCIGCIAAVGICVASAGTATPFVSAAAAPWLIGGGAVGGYLIGDKADKEEIEREKRLEQNQNCKQIKQEAEQLENNNNQIRNTIQDIEGKLNGNIPRQSGETDESLRQQLVIAQSNLRTGESKLGDLRKEMNNLRKEIAGGGSLMSLLGLDKLSFTDKLMIVAAIVLVIWLLKG